MWRIINSNLGNVSKKPTPKVIISNGEILNDPSQISNAFGEYFANSVTTLMELNFAHQNNTCTKSKKENINSMYFMPVLEDTVIELIQQLPNKNSTGIDEVPAKLFKECCFEFAHYITIIINNSVHLGQFPRLLKTAKVVPVFKKGDSQEISNYRAISILSNFSKVIERAVYNSIYSFININETLTTCQHGFRVGRSTETATIDFVQYIHDKVDPGEHVFGVFFDLSRAFDTINPDFLSTKLSAVGIRGPINDWLKSYMTDRALVVRVGEVDSQLFNTNLGTPQGSILGPLLFLLFINDLPDYILQPGGLFMYADDTTMVISDVNFLNAVNKVNNILEVFKVWCDRNKLIINLNKTECIKFSYGNRAVPDINFSLDNTQIKITNKTKFLGVQVDENLKFSDQVSQVCSKLNKSLFALSSLKNDLNEDSLLSLYYAQVYSAMCYNITVWGQSTEATRVFIIQKRILRLMFSLDYRESCREIFKCKCILTFISIYILKLLCFVYLNQRKFKKNVDIHDYPTRNKEKLCLGKCTHQKYKKSPVYAGCSLFNILPDDIKSAHTLAEFKNRLKSLLIKGCFYTLEEFVTGCKNVQNV